MCAAMWFLVLMIMRGKLLGVQALRVSGGSDTVNSARCVELPQRNDKLSFAALNLLW